MALRLCANCCSSNPIICGPENRTAILQLNFPSSLAKLRRNPSLSPKNYRHLNRYFIYSNKSFRFATNLNCKSCKSVTASATRSDVLTIEENSSSSLLNCKSCKSVTASATRSDVLTVEENSSSSLLNSTPPAIASSWLEFAKNVSGEWDGYGAYFSVEGKPIELPESVVPETYWEWEVNVFDWQTQCPTLAQTEDRILVYKLIKLLPTVGCEADAATRYSVDERTIGGADSLASAFAYNSSGCYVAIWSLKDHPSYRLLELEHCLVDPHNHESRVRVVQVVRVEKNKFCLQNIKVFCEQWYGPFCNGEQLGGCSIRDSAFASTEALKGSEVAGVWQGLHAVACFNSSQHGLHQELQDDDVRKLARDKQGLVLLPKQLWCSLKEGEDGETCCEVGWLLEQGSAITSKCIFSPDSKLKEISIARETAAKP